MSWHHPRLGVMRLKESWDPDETPPLVAPTLDLPTGTILWDKVLAATDGHNIASVQTDLDEGRSWTYIRCH